MTGIDHTIEGARSQTVEIDTESDNWLFMAGTSFRLRGYTAAISELETSIGNTITVENARIEARWGLYLRGSDTNAVIEDGRIDATIGIVMVGSNQHVENYATIRSSDGSGISVGDDFGGVAVYLGIAGEGRLYVAHPARRHLFAVSLVRIGLYPPAVHIRDLRVRVAKGFLRFAVYVFDSSVHADYGHGHGGAVDYFAQRVFVFVRTCAEICHKHPRIIYKIKRGL